MCRRRRMKFTTSFWHWRPRRRKIEPMTAYSSKNLIDKLGIKPGARMIIMRAPKGYLDLLPDLEEHADVVTRLGGRFDFIQYFATSVEQLSAVMPNLAAHLEP